MAVAVGALVGPADVHRAHVHLVMAIGLVDGGEAAQAIGQIGQQVTRSAEIAEKGLTEYNLDDARIKRAALGAARRCIVLADRSKLGRVALALVARLSAVDTLVTDAPPEHPTVMAAANIGIQVVHVVPDPVATELAP